MKVSLAWIGILLIVSVLVYFTLYGYHVYEKFQDIPLTQNKLLEGFLSRQASASGLNITTCPAGSKSFIDTNGRTVCCMGDVVSEKCVGETICSLSEETIGLPSCTTWYESYLREKGRGRCPRSLYNYFESDDGKVKGCTDGRLKADGSGPASQDQKKCILYLTQQQDLGQLDSCTNQRLLENTVCFPGSNIPTDKSLVSNVNGWLPALVQCKFGDITRNTAGICQTDDSMLRFMKSLYDIVNQWLGTSYTVDQWKASSKSWDPLDKLNFCSVTKKYKIDKTLAFADLPGLSVF